MSTDFVWSMRDCGRMIGRLGLIRSRDKIDIIYIELYICFFTYPHTLSYSTLIITVSECNIGSGTAEPESGQFH
jgi:hypothetical protein